MPTASWNKHAGKLGTDGLNDLITLIAETPSGSFGRNVVTVGGPDTGAQFSNINDAVAVITDSSATKPYTILHVGGVITVPAGAADYADLSAGATKDYISLVGLNRDTCFLLRPASPGTGNAVIQAADHCEISGLTIDSAVSRLIHWDTGAGAHLIVSNCYLRNGGGGNGVSTGVTGDGSILEVRGNLLNVNVSVHNGGGAGWATFVCTGNTMLASAGAAIGIDMTAGINGNSITAYLAGNVGKYFNVDASHAVRLSLSDASTARLIVYDDGAGHRYDSASAVAKFWNCIYWSQVGRYDSTTATSEANIVAVTPSAAAFDKQGDCARVTVANSQWPAVVIEQTDPSGVSGWAPRLATGPYAEVTCNTAEIVVGDVIVTSTTSGEAMANNGQTDLTRILGWAIAAKAAGASGRVKVRMNRAINAW